MRSFLQQVFFDNTVQDYLILVAAILLILLFNRYLSRHITSVVFRMLHKASWNIGKEVFVSLLKGPIHAFLILSIVFLVLDPKCQPGHLLDGAAHGLEPGRHGKISEGFLLVDEEGEMFVCRIAIQLGQDWSPGNDRRIRRQWRQ